MKYQCEPERNAAESINHADTLAGDINDFGFGLCVLCTVCIATQPRATVCFIELHCGPLLPTQYCVAAKITLLSNLFR